MFSHKDLQNGFIVQATKIHLGSETTEAIFSLFGRQSERYFTEGIQQLFPNLPESDKQFLLQFRQNIQSECIKPFQKQFDYPLQQILFHQVCEEEILSNQRKKPAKMMILVLYPNLKQYLFLGFIQNIQDLSTKQQMRITIVAQKQTSARFQNMSLQNFLCYLRQQIVEINRNRSIVKDQPFDISKSKCKINKQKESLTLNKQIISNKLFKKKKSCSQSKKLTKIRSTQTLICREQSDTLRNYLSEIDKSIQIPANICNLVDNIPIEISQQLLQKGISRTNSSISSFKSYLYRFISGLAQKEPNKRFLLKDRNLSNNQNSRAEFLNFYLQMSQQDYFFQNEVPFLSLQNTVKKQELNHEAKLDIEDQNNMGQDQIQEHKFTIIHKEESSQTKEIASKIRLVLEQKKLKPRSVIQIASKFIQAKYSGKITEKTSSQELLNMDMNIGVNYCEALYPLFMTELKQQKNNSTEFFNILNGSIKQIKNLIIQDKYFETEEFNLKTVHKPISISHLCKLINDQSIESTCNEVRTSLDTNIIIKMIVKVLKRGNCIFILVYDMEHNFNDQFIFPRSQKVYPSQLKQKITKSKNIQFKRNSKILHSKILPLQTICSIIEVQIFNGNNIFFTGFYKAQTTEGNHIKMMIRVSKQQRINEHFQIYKIQIISIVKENKWDRVIPYSLQIDNRKFMNEERQEENK